MSEMEDSHPPEEDKPKRGHMSVRAVVTKKDGTVIDLGTVAEGWVGFEASSDPS